MEKLTFKMERFTLGSGNLWFVKLTPPETYPEPVEFCVEGVTMEQALKRALTRIERKEW